MFNPTSKLNTFKEGKKNIEQALVKAPNNVEIDLSDFPFRKSPPFLATIIGFKKTRFCMKKKERFNQVLKSKLKIFKVIKWYLKNKS